MPTPQFTHPHPPALFTSQAQSQADQQQSQAGAEHVKHWMESQDLEGSPRAAAQQDWMERQDVEGSPRAAAQQVDAFWGLMGDCCKRWMEGLGPGPASAGFGSVRFEGGRGGGLALVTGLEAIFCRQHASMSTNVWGAAPQGLQVLLASANLSACLFTCTSTTPPLACSRDPLLACQHVPGMLPC
eukprot:1157509-Pelagomonas_calceolata.AAC.13